MRNQGEPNICRLHRKCEKSTKWKHAIITRKSAYVPTGVTQAAIKSFLVVWPSYNLYVPIAWIPLTTFLITKTTDRGKSLIRNKKPDENCKPFLSTQKNIFYRSSSFR